MKMAKNENKSLTKAQIEILKHDIPRMIANIIDFEKGEFFDYEINFWDGDLVKVRLSKQIQGEDGHVIEDELIFATSFGKTEEGDLI